MDTTHIRPGTLKQYLRGKPLFLRLGRQSFRAPILGADPKGAEKTPPADVPEYEILCALQKQRRTLVHFLER